MLVLSRKANEEIIIDNRIRVRVIQLAGGKVRLGFEAPRDVAIHRAEVLFAEVPACSAADSFSFNAPLAAFESEPLRIPR